MQKKILAICMALLLCALGSLALAEDTVFPAFAAEILSGGMMPKEGEEAPVTLSEAAFADSKITLVNFWATWCPPCIAELPDLAQIAEKTGGNIQVVGVLLDGVSGAGQRDESAITAMAALLENAKAEYAVILPDEALLRMSVGMQYVPTTYVVDEAGNVLEVAVGIKDADAWIAFAQKAADKAYGDGVVQLVEK